MPPLRKNSATQLAQQQESLRRLLNAVSLLSGAHMRLRRSRQDVRAFLQDPIYRPPLWTLTYDKTYVVVPSNTDPILAQFAAESDLVLQRRKLQYVADNVVGRPPCLPPRGDLRKYIRIQDAGEGGVKDAGIFSPTNCEDKPSFPSLRLNDELQARHTTSSVNPPTYLATITRTFPALYPGEIEVTEDFAERFHAPLFVKLFLFVILFDLDLQYLTLLMVAFVLHVHGVFEPIMRFFGNGHRRRQDPLDRVLQNLEQRRQQQMQQPVEDLPQPVMVETTDRGYTNDGQAAAEEIPAAVTRPPPSSSVAVRVLYQSVVMFVGTLLPWWTPDQRYLV